MAKQNWKPGNMLYPLPAVMVSCQSSTAHDPLCERPELDGKPNIITVAWAGTSAPIRRWFRSPSARSATLIT